MADATIPTRASRPGPASVDRGTDLDTLLVLREAWRMEQAYDAVRLVDAELERRRDAGEPTVVPEWWWSDHEAETGKLYTRTVDRAREVVPVCCNRRLVASDMLEYYGNVAPDVYERIRARFPEAVARAEASPWGLWLCDGCRETLRRENVVKRDEAPQRYRRGAPRARIPKLPFSHEGYPAGSVLVLVPTDSLARLRAAAVARGLGQLAQDVDNALAKRAQVTEQTSG